MPVRIRVRVLSTALLGMGLLAAPVPPASAAGSPIFGGTTSQSDMIVITADDRAQRVRKVVLAFEAPCTDGRRYVFVWPLTTARADSETGTRVDRLPMSRNDRGVFAGKQVTHRSRPDGTSSTVDVRISRGA